ncbi:hypothetical protein [Novosphingobium decolorationis]|uniref:Tetratricopeptide repeat protein n=1 Tax=Novosphingobium decolorationis TaxID=2698673 RepID=A0ABX8E466_9SPHN|nr:hypothetical protein [Novosphingobium decolorationis]QVM83713.1 hypothetical protein HT578_08385 [Novosphingobium decolorationis]
MPDSKRQPGAMKWKLIGIGTAIMLAIPGAAVQLDLQSARDASLARYVPKFARSTALEVTARDQDAGSDKALAYAESERLLARRPVPAENLSLYGLLAFETGKPKQADAAFALAAQRGWRDTLTQELVINAALQTQDWQVAADRLTALWSANLDAPNITEVSKAALGVGAVQEAFGARLAHKPRWQSDFLRWAGENLSLESAANTVHAAIVQRAEFKCNELAALARNMAFGGQPDAAALAWSGPCRNPKALSASDFGFDEPDEGYERGPFEWIYPEFAAFSRTFNSDGKPAVMTVSNSDPENRTAAMRLVRLAPGAHSVTVSAQGSAASRVFVRVECIAQDGERGLIARDYATAGAIAFEVPAVSCSEQLLTVMVGRGETAAMYLQLS